MEAVSRMQVKNWRRRAKAYKVVEQSSDPILGLAVLGFAEIFASTMEQRLDVGESMDDVASAGVRMARDNFRGEVTFEPHTPWGDVVAEYLRDCWKYGRQYWKWYKKQPG